ncbi:MAG TPA: alpha/beta hydrolase [Chitinophagaceae bacterium]|nr:alpha/beta hydrolase [Chitinophagaceae bacterium]
MQNGYAPVNGLDLYYEIHGQGKPVVLIHGGGSTIQTSFGYLLPLMAAHYQVIAVEMQAHGHTKDRDTPESFKQDADDIAALLRYLSIEKADIVGFSNGGQTALQLGISHPQVVNKLVIISAFYKRAGTIAGFFDGFPDATLKDMPALYHEEYLKINNDPAGLQRMFEQDKNRMMRFTDWSDEEIASIQAPALIIAGDQDIVTPEHAAEIARQIRNAKLLIMPGTHGSFIGEMFAKVPGSKIPEATFIVIDEFLRS